MTIVTKNGVSVKKMEIIRLPIREPLPLEDHPHYHGPGINVRRAVYLLFMLLSSILIMTTGLFVFRQMFGPLRTGVTITSYQGYCTVTLPADFREDPPLIGPNFQVVPIVNNDEQAFEIISTLGDKRGKEIVNALHEKLDIEDEVEKIGVFDNGHHVNFIHDFSTNLTSIVDSDRCFIMDLEPELVLGPAVFAAGLARGEEFDVSRVRSALRAILPALTDLASSRLDPSCNTLPSYRLARDETVLIRKRSTEDPPHDYIHFSGKHVQEIKIQNMQEILDYENENKKV